MIKGVIVMGGLGESVDVEGWHKIVWFETGGIGGVEELYIGQISNV